MYAVIAGRPRASGVAALPPLPDGSPPRILPLAKGMSLVIADVPSGVYDAAAVEARLADLDWVSRAGAAHHAVIDALTSSHAIVPLRFLTLFSSEARATAAFVRSRAKLAAALARVRGRQEWVLRIGKPDPARLSAPPPARAKRAGSGSTFLRAKADAKRERAERASRVAADAADVFEALRALSDAAHARPVPPGTNLLLDAAFLVTKRQTRTLQRTLTEAADGLLHAGCAVSLTGPWPPYSFAELD